MLKEYDVVELARDLPVKGIPKGSTGTILMILSCDPPVYLIEFTEMTETGLVTLGTEEVSGDYLAQSQ